MCVRAWTHAATRAALGKCGEFPLAKEVANPGSRTKQFNPQIRAAVEVELLLDGFRPALPRAARRSGLAARSRMAAVHCSVVRAWRPVWFCVTRSAFMPTGLAMTGRAAAMYWTILKPHFPRVQRSSGVGAMPMSPRRSDWLSVASLQGRCSMGMPGLASVESAMVTRVRPGIFSAAQRIDGRHCSRYGSVEREPIQTRRGVEVAACCLTA